MSTPRRGRGRGRAPGPSRAASSEATPASADRLLRQKADRARQYVDGMDSDEEEDTLKQTFSVMDKLACPKFSAFFVRELRGEEANVEYFQRTGFNVPLLVPEKTGLGLTAPDGSFTVTDVKNGVGARRAVEVMDCTTQRNSEMTMKEWEEYYNTAAAERDGRKLNVISLEFSYTKLEPYVIAPKVVRQIDWVDNVWPRHLKEQQTEGTNDLREMKYPKVQKYCLMSVAGCYTDFHIDFGGTSVWYHIIRGKKVFWLIPPTETNLKLYEQWTMSGKQGNVFFGDLVEKCGKVQLEAGNTFFIPSGWIHAVFTPEDSLVFGGNFLHSFAIEKQIRVAQIEEMTKVPHKFRFPFFTELQWFALDKYVYHLMGKSHLSLEEEAAVRLLGTKQERLAFRESLEEQHTHITPQELFGLKAIVMYIHALAVSKKAVPPLLPEPINLVRDIRTLVEGHKRDDPDMAVTGKPLLHWPGVKNDPGFARPTKHAGKTKKEKAGGGAMASKDPFGVKKEKSGGGAAGGAAQAGRRASRVPCKICQACISPDCGMCQFCADMVRFGGSGKLRKPCQMRQCLQPLLLPSAVCCVCGLDGWYAETHVRLIDRPPSSCALMECTLCFEVCHPSCITDLGVEGYIKMEMPNTWECPKCVKAGRAVKLESTALFTPSGLPVKGMVPPVAAVVDGGGGAAADGPSPAKMPKTEAEGEGGHEHAEPDKKPMPYGPDSTFSGPQLFCVRGTSDQPKHELRAALAKQIMAASTKPLREPPYVVRPPPKERLEVDEIWDRRRAGEEVDLLLERGVMLPVFARLGTVDLSRCVTVCKRWTKIIQDPLLWSAVKLSRKKITSHLLSLVVQRQPVKLYLDFSIISKQQLSWLLPRIPQTRTLSLCGVEYHATAVALNTVNCPMLQELDLSYVTNFNDSALYKLLSSPKDSRPGLLDKKSRQKGLMYLNLSGTEISDVGLRYITQFLGQLQRLEISNCWKLSDAGLAQLASSDGKTAETLQELNVSGCKGVTNTGLQHLLKCPKLVRVNCNNTSISTDSMKKFTENSAENLKVVGGIIQRRLTKR